MKEQVPESLIEPILMVFAHFGGYVDAEGIVSDYLAGSPVIPAIGRHGRWGLDHLMRTMGHEPPKQKGLGK